MTPQVSIIIPCCNGARYIPSLAQSLRPVIDAGNGACEVIFIDDGSTDRSAELAERHLSGARFIRQKNSGLSAARNAGAAMACGEYLQLLDVDDTIEPDKLSIQVSAADRTFADVIYSDWRLLTFDGSKLVRTESFAPAQAPCEMVEALLGDWYVPPVGYLFRRSAYLEAGGCAPQLKVWQDFALYLVMAISGKCHHYVPGLLSNYNRYTDVQSLARRNVATNARERDYILRTTIADLKKRGELTDARRTAAARAFFRVLRTSGISDPAWLRGVASSIFELDPDFQPTGAGAYRTVSRLAGLVAAERVAILARNLRSGSESKTHNILGALPRFRSRNSRSMK